MRHGYRRRMGTRFSVLVLSLVALLASGCGIGVGQSLTHSTIGPQTSSFSDDIYKPAATAGFARVNSFTLYDSTGILLAALGTAGNAYNAQRAAEQQAVASGARAGDTYSYSYQVVQPAVGTNTYMTIAFGTAGRGSVDNVSFTGGDISYFLFDLRSTFVTWDLVGGMTLGMSLGALWESWKGNSTAGEIDSSWIGMPLGLSLNYPFAPMLSVTPRVAVDPLIGPLGGLLSNGGHWLWLETGARLDFRPFSWLLVTLDAMHRITPWELGGATGTSTTFSLGLAYMYGM